MSAAEPVDGAGPGPSAGSLDPQSPPLVVGLGPVGLTLALGLARAGVRSIAIDRKPMPDSHSRATLIVPRTLETFQRLGVLEAFLERGQLNRAIRLLRSGSRRELLRFDFAPLRSRTTTPYALAISQDRTERILLDAVRNTGLVDLRFGTALRSFTDHPDHISADLSSPAGPASLQAPFLIGADGAHSAVRRRLGWTMVGKTYPTRAFLADVTIVPSADTTDGWLVDPDAASFTVAVRFATGTWRLIESAIPDTVTDAALPERARVLTERLFGAGAHRETLWTAAYRKHERRAPVFTRGRVVLAGDAAHLNSPAGGQGMNAGIADAAALTWRLVHLLERPFDEPGDALTGYNEERTYASDHQVRPLTNGIELMETLPPFIRSALFGTVGLLRRTPLPGVIAHRLSMID